jgi:uncharacterized protein YchJ
MHINAHMPQFTHVRKHAIAMQACCRKYHVEASKPATPEELLRARYSAYAIKNPEYIASTTSPDSAEHLGNANTYLRVMFKFMKGMLMRLGWRVCLHACVCMP